MVQTRCGLNHSFFVARSRGEATIPKQPSTLTARGINPVDQLFNGRAWRQRHQSPWRTEHDRVTEHARPPQRQGDLRRAHIGKEVHVLDVGKRDAFFLATVAYEQRVAADRTPRRPD